MGCWKGMVRGGVCGTGSSSVNWRTRPDSSKEGLTPCLHHSISITLSYRLTIEFLIDGKEIIPIDIGTHVRVY